MPAQENSTMLSHASVLRHNVPAIGAISQQQQGGFEGGEEMTPRVRNGRHFSDASLTNERNHEIMNPEEEEEEQQHQLHHQQQHRQQQQQQQENGGGGGFPSKGSKMKTDIISHTIDTASELRRRLTAPMVVNDINDPIENLVVGAAMQTYVDENDDEVNSSNSFDNFIEKLLEFPPGPAGVWMKMFHLFFINIFLFLWCVVCGVWLFGVWF